LKAVVDRDAQRRRRQLPVDEFASDAALEEAAAAVARQYAVVLAARRVATHEACESGRTSLHQGRRQSSAAAVVEGGAAWGRGGDRRAASGRHGRGHGRLVEDHPVDHRRREDGRRRRGDRARRRAGERRHGGVVGQVPVRVMAAVERCRRRGGADLGVGGGRVVDGRRRRRRRALEAAGDDRADRRHTAAARACGRQASHTHGQSTALEMKRR